MIPNDQPLRGQTIERMLMSCLKRIDEDQYSQWESDFIKSISEQFNFKGDLSTKQCEILERLYDK